MPDQLLTDEGNYKRMPCPTCGQMVTTNGFGYRQHQRLHNRPTTPDEKARLRFEKMFTVLPNGCWQWNKTTRNNPYGSFHFAGRNYMAFIFSWWLYRGALVKTPPLELDHLCRNKPCVNPEHLEPVTRSVNNKRALVRPACPRGHAFTPSNIRYSKQGHRKCIKCDNANSAKQYANHREERKRKDHERYARKRAAQRDSPGVGHCGD
jgi:hypothetical protein